MKCHCGCGGETKGGRYLPGHGTKGLITSQERIREMRRLNQERNGKHTSPYAQDEFNMTFAEIAEELGTSVHSVELIYLNAMHKVMWQFVGRDLENII